LIDYFFAGFLVSFSCLERYYNTFNENVNYLSEGIVEYLNSLYIYILFLINKERSAFRA